MFTSLVLVLVITLFLALEPDIYVDNFMRLIPLNKRSRVRQTFDTIHISLGRWLFTRFISMVLVGVLMFIGLSVIGMPLALSLAIIAGIGAFIPTFGPIIALIPAVLVALLQPDQPIVAVALLYLGTQAIDNYLVTPLIEKSLLYLPPRLHHFRAALVRGDRRRLGGAVSSAFSGGTRHPRADAVRRGYFRRSGAVVRRVELAASRSDRSDTSPPKDCLR